MAHDPATRERAERLYVRRGWSFRRVADEVGVGKATLIRWARAGEWQARRRNREELKRATEAMAIELARAAANSRDPQQAYAASQAVALAGLREERAQRPPSAARIAEAMFDVLVRHPDVGPVVRRHRRQLIAETLREVERLEQKTASAKAPR